MKPSLSLLPTSLLNLNYLQSCHKADAIIIIMYADARVPMALFKSTTDMWVLLSLPHNMKPLLSLPHNMKP